MAPQLKQWGDKILGTLTRDEIIKLINDPDNALVVTPLLSKKQIGDISIDLRLSNQFIVFRDHAASAIVPAHLDAARLHEIQERQIIRYGKQFVLHPGSLALGCTFEFIRLPNTVEGQVEGRSSWARLGLQIATATSVEPGFSGVITLELSNVGSMPLALTPGVRVAQLVLHSVDGTLQDPYSGQKKYKFAVGPQFSKIGQDPEVGVFEKSD